MSLMLWWLCCVAVLVQQSLDVTFVVVVVLAVWVNQPLLLAVALWVNYNLQDV